MLNFRLDSKDRENKTKQRLKSNRAISFSDQKEYEELQKNCVKYRINGMIENPENMDIDLNKFHRYIWKVFKDEYKRKQRPYNDNYIASLLSYSFGLLIWTEENEKITIEIWSSLSEIINWEDDVKESMNFEEEKEYIETLCDQYFWYSRKDNLEIISMEDKHPELFLSLRENGEEALNSKPTQEVPFNALTIAQFLYWVAQENKSFRKYIDRSPERVEKTGKNFPQYYALIEVAIRLYDFLENDITTHWGVPWQKAFDDVILMILNGDMKKYPEFQTFCKARLEDKQFSTIHVDGNEYEKLLDEKVDSLYKRNRLTRKIALTLAGILSLTVMWVWTAKIINYKQEKKMEQTIQDMISESVKDIKIINMFETRYWEFKENDVEWKSNYINGLVTNIAEKLKLRYDVDDKRTMTERRHFIVDDILQEQFLDKIWLEARDGTYIYEEFIRKFVQESKFKLVANWISIDPYLQYRNYEKSFTEALNSDEFASMNNGNMDYMKDRDGNIPFDRNSYKKENIGQYITRDWSNYNLAIIQEKSAYDFRAPLLGKQHLAASYDTEHLSGTTWSDSKIKWRTTQWTWPYNTFHAKEIAMDYYIVTDPDIQKAIDMFWEYYNPLNYKKNYKTLEEQNNEKYIEYQIVKDRVNHKKDLKNPDILNFVNNVFVQWYKDTLISMWFNTNMYDKYKKYKYSFENTLDYNWKLSSFTYKERAKYNNKYLWEYRTKSWKRYFIEILTIDNKEYLLAKEKNDKYETSWCFSYGKEVAEEYLD